MVAAKHLTGGGKPVTNPVEIKSWWTALVVRTGSASVSPVHVPIGELSAVGRGNVWRYSTIEYYLIEAKYVRDTKSVNKGSIAQISEVRAWRQRGKSVRQVTRMPFSLKSKGGSSWIVKLNRKMRADLDVTVVQGMVDAFLALVPRKPSWMEKPSPVMKSQMLFLNACPRCDTGTVKQDYEPLTGTYRLCMTCGWIKYL